MSIALSGLGGAAGVVALVQAGHWELAAVVGGAALVLEIVLLRRRRRPPGRRTDGFVTRRPVPGEDGR